MAEILSQGEIEDLISALSSGQLTLEEAKKVDKDRRIRPYDFRRPNKFSKDQLRTLQMVHENFARLLTTFLSAHLRAMVQISIVSVDQLPYEDFMRGAQSPTVLVIFSMEPLKGNAVLEVTPQIAFPIIDRLFGGRGQAPPKVRPLTEIEQTVVEKLGARILETLREAWKNVVDIKAKIEGIETNPLFAQVIAPTETTVLIAFEAKVADIGGMLNLSMPYILFEPIISRLSVRQWFAATGGQSTAEAKAALKKRISAALVPVIAELGSTTISVKELLGLGVGDVVALDTGVDDDLAVRVGGRLKFKARPGLVGNNLAVQVTSVGREGDDQR